MAVDRIEKYRQKNGDNILKVILKSTNLFQMVVIFIVIVVMRNWLEVTLGV